MIKKLLLISAMFAGSGMLSAHATPVLSFTPSAQSVVLGGSVSVDVVLSGLLAGDILSAFDISVDYVSSILNSNSLTITTIPFGTAPISSANATSGSIEWNLTSLVADSILQGLQGSSVTLGTLSFNTLSAGTSALSFSYHDLTGLNALGLDHTVSDGSITVTDRSGAIPVPEPTIMLLMALGAFGMAGAKHRKAKFDVV